MLDAIDEDRCVVGVSGIDYISNPDIQAHRDSVGDVGYEGNINYELLLSLDPDLVLLYGVNGASSMEGKLKELNIPFMYVGDYLEESPLGKAEWPHRRRQRRCPGPNPSAAWQRLSYRTRCATSTVCR